MSIAKNIVQGISDAFGQVEELKRHATEAWTNDHIELGASPGHEVALRRAARKLNRLADRLEEKREERREELFEEIDEFVDDLGRRGDEEGA